MTLLLAGPPIVYLILLHVIGIAAAELGQETSQFWDDAIRVVGIVLIGLSVYVFFRGQRVQDVPDDTFDFTIPEGWTFENTMRTIARNHAITFEEFNQEELDTPLRGKELVAANMMDALGMMRSDDITPGVPRFDVIEENSTIKIRKQNAQQEANP